MAKGTTARGPSPKKPVLVQHDLPGMPFFMDTPWGPSGMLLRTASDAFSRWYMALKGAMAREKARQEAYREENGLKKKARVPSQPLVPTDAESSVSEVSESVIRSMFGHMVADYARERYEHALKTGDMRAFKIRLLMLKARDSLTGVMHDEFAEHCDRYVTSAEEAAGCKACPGPRRLSRAERERKMRREQLSGGAPQVDLFGHEYAAHVPSPVPSPVPPQRQPPVQPPVQAPSASSVSRKTGHGKCGKTNTSVKDILDAPIRKGLPSVGEVLDAMDSVFGGQDIERMADTVDEKISTPADEVPNEQKPPQETVVSPIETVQPKNGSKLPVQDIDDGPAFTLYDHRLATASEHKARGYYETVAQILEDLEAGKITMYSSPKEVVADMNCDVLSPAEAMMFMSAMMKLSDKGGGKRRRKAKKQEVEFEEFEEDDQSAVRGEDDEEDEDAEDEGTGYSYNPDGFGACRSDWE